MKLKENQTIQKLFLCFWMYAVLGWLYEVFLEVVVYQWGFTNRGVLFGPYCPVYGVGAITFLLCFGKLMRKKDNRTLNIVKPLLIFLGCMAVATLIELVTSYILEAATGSWPWQTYADYKYNFQARIAPFHFDKIRSGRCILPLHRSAILRLAAEKAFTQGSQYHRFDCPDNRYHGLYIHFLN